MQNANLVEGALQLAALGFHILPAHGIVDSHCTCRKRGGCPSMGKHPVPGKWAEVSTTDPERIKSWLNCGKNRNIAVHCGPSNLLVIDVDFKNGAESDYARLINAVPEIAEAPTARTGSGGYHHYFRFRGETVLKNSAGRVGDGIDVRTANGIVIAPPSVNLGGPYEWILPPWNGIPDTPPELLDILLQAQADSSIAAPAARRRDAIVTLPIEEGARHSTFAWLAGGLRHHGLRAEDTLRVLETIRRNECIDPDSFPPAELESIVADLYSTRGLFSIRGFLHDWISDLSKNQFRVALAYFLEIAGGLPTPAIKRIEELTGLNKTAILLARRQLREMGAIEVINGRYNTYSARVTLLRKPDSFTTY